jgi:multiple sugar transport system permease protein
VIGLRHEAAPERTRRHSMSQEAKWGLTFLSLPSVVIVFFLGFPVAWGIYISLTNLALTGADAVHPSFIGLTNYAELFTSSSFWLSVKASLEYLIGSGLVGQVGLGLALALLIRRLPLGFRQFLMGLIVLSWVIPEIVTAFIWSSYLQTPGGLFDVVVGLFGIVPQSWLYRYPMTFLILANIWRGTAFSLLVFGAAIEAIPKELFDAAQIDGANGVSILGRIILPLIRNSMATALVLITLWTLSDFTLIYVLTAGGPGYATDVLPVFIYQNSFTYYELGYGTALSVVLLLIASGLSLLYLRLVGRDY